ncbi:2-phosphoxylose phosphatase 1 isoform X1 [Euwallacea similis]|uniref:2-phosphoxylose phosphatase 1 isoform X1 n=1 Tax=Euwallacea similis TaxID=1736056 RepID=UPI003450809D
MTLRLISQNRAVHCYLVLILWILVVIAGIYKLLNENHMHAVITPVTTELFHNLGIANVKTKRLYRICNFPEEIYQGNEGILDNKKWLLKGLIILIRHGDRGPLQHVKGISTVNCNTDETNILNTYKSYLHNLTVMGKIQWTGPGPFHGFPVIPRNPDQCQLAQLTMQGISQLLNLGQMLKKSYHEVWPKLQSLSVEDVLIYSTRYRRTFQSALAFLYGFISNETVAKIGIRESQSMSFCFKDCECPVTDSLRKLIQKTESHQLKSHPAIETLSQTIGEVLLSTNAEHSSLLKDPTVIRDALLTYVCHRSGLPCDSFGTCLGRQNIAGIIAYTDWMNYQKWKNEHWGKLCLLKAYGQIKHIVQQMLHMVGSNGPHLVVYSGHDFSLLQLATALGLEHDPLLLRYASRLVFEIYLDNRQRSIDDKGIYFRLLSNGNDVTHEISFCKNIVNVDKKNSVCKIEDIVRFLHDDYFSSLNVTNFKDACIKKSEREAVDELFQFR